MAKLLKAIQDRIFKRQRRHGTERAECLRGELGALSKDLVVQLLKQKLVPEANVSQEDAHWNHGTQRDKCELPTTSQSHHDPTDDVANG